MRLIAGSIQRHETLCIRNLTKCNQSSNRVYRRQVYLTSFRSFHLRAWHNTSDSGAETSQLSMRQLPHQDSSITVGGERAKQTAKAYRSSPA